MAYTKGSGVTDQPQKGGTFEIRYTERYHL